MVQQTSTGRPALGASSSNYSEWNIDDKWSFQVWKSGEMSNTSTGRPVYDKFVIDDDMDSDTATESNLSLRSRSFLNRVNDRLRKMLDQSSKDAMQDIDSIGSICIHGKELLRQCTLHQKYRKGSHNEQMFDISEKLIVGQSDEIYGVNTINWYDSSWKHSSLIGDEEVISLSHAAKVYVFSDSVLCLGKVNQNPTSNTACEQQLDWFKDSSQYRTLDTIDGEPMEFEWNIFPGFTTLQLIQEVQKFMNKKMSEPEQFQGRIIFVSMFNDSIWGIKDNETECIANSTLVSSFAKKISSRTLVIPRTRIRNKVVFYSQRKTTRRMGQSR